MNERKGLVFTAIAVSLVGIVTGLFLGGGLLPSQAANQLYNESTTTSKTVRVVEHSHDGIPLHKHIITIVVTTTETTPHGSFHDFAVQLSPFETPTATPSIPAPGITPPAAAPIPAQGANEVLVQGREFRPSNITVPVATTVTWNNKDNEMFTITSDIGLFNESLPPGGSFSYTFTAPGIFSYHCEYHNTMTGTVTVE